LNAKPNPNKQIIIGVAVILGICLICCVAVGVAALLGAPALLEWASSSYRPTTPLQVGSPAPDFELTSLEGESVRLSQFQGQPVLLVFGATWCPPCRAEAPLVQELHEGHPEMIVIWVNMEESAPTVQKYVDEAGLTHRVLLDKSGRVSDTYHIYAIPTSFFIDVDGILRAMLIEELTPDYLTKTLPLIGVTP
jgi:peroxiredoxin